MITRIIEDERLLDLYGLEWTDEFFDSLSRSDQMRVEVSVIGLILRLESLYLQYEKGLLDELAFGAYGMFQPKTREPYFRSRWQGYRDNRDPDFVRFFEDQNGYTR